MKLVPSLRLCAIALGLLLSTQALAADEYHPLLKAKKFAEAEKMASAKLAQEPGNAAAMVARTSAILGVGDGRIEDAVKQAETCVARHANSAQCHLALGKALGAKAMAGGMMSAMSYAGTIRDAFKKSVELEPRGMDARFALLDYYLMAPGFVGGGTGKAETLAKETALINPEAARLMLANLESHEDKLAKAESSALAIKPGSDEDVQQRHEDLLVTIGAKQLGEKKFADAQRVLREAQKRYPDSDSVPYFLARVQQEQGQHKEALGALEQVLVKTPKAHVHYRIAQSLAALGEKARAVAAFEKALSFKAGLSKKFKSDAEDQIKSLRG